MWANQTAFPTMWGNSADTAPTWNDYLASWSKKNTRLKGSPWWQPSPFSADSSNPFTQYKNVKESDVDAANRKLLSEWSGLSSSPEENRPQFGTYTRNQGLQKKIEGQFGQNEIDTKNANQSVADFASQILGSEPAEYEQFGRESNAINRIINPGGMETDLANARRRSRIAGTQTLQNQIGQIGARANLGRLMGGTDSSVNALAMSAAGQAGLGLNQYLTEQERQDINNLAQLRLGAAGRINSLRDAIIARRQLPIELQQRVLSGNLGRFATLAGLTGANEMTYQLPTRYDLLGRQIAGTGELGRNIMAGTEYTYEAPFQRETGAFYQTPPFTRGPAPNGWGAPVFNLVAGGRGSASQPAAPMISQPALGWGGQGAPINAQGQYDPSYQESPGYYPFSGSNEWAPSYQESPGYYPYL